MTTTKTRQRSTVKLADLVATGYISDKQEVRMDYNRRNMSSVQGVAFINADGSVEADDKLFDTLSNAACHFLTQAGSEIAVNGWKHWRVPNADGSCWTPMTDIRKQFADDRNVEANDDNDTTEVVAAEEIIEVSTRENVVDQNAVDAATVQLAEYLAAKMSEAKVSLEATVDQKVKDVAPREHFIVIKQGDAETKIKGKAHSQLQKVLDVIAMGEIPMLVGPAGTGKTVLAQQVSDVLGVSFDAISCSGGLTEGKMFGRSVPNIHTGEEVYAPTAYVRAYEQGGVFLLDEFDAGDDNMMCSLNQSLANGYMMLPERKDSPKASRHEQSYIICTANTYGTGADRQYVSRNQMDAATMDRFTIIEIGYDAEIEDQVCPDKELIEKFRDYRKAIQENGLERIVSYRTLRKAYKQRQIGWTDKEIDAQFFAGWHHDEVVMVRGEGL